MEKSLGVGKNDVNGDNASKYPYSSQEGIGSYRRETFVKTSSRGKRHEKQSSPLEKKALGLAEPDPFGWEGTRYRRKGEGGSEVLKNFPSKEGGGGNAEDGG